MIKRSVIFVVLRPSQVTSVVLDESLEGLVDVGIDVRTQRSGQWVYFNTN